MHITHSNVVLSEDVARKSHRNSKPTASSLEGQPGSYITEQNTSTRVIKYLKLHLLFVGWNSK